MPTTHGHNANISRISSNFPQFIVGCGDSTHRSAVGGTERKPEQNELSSTNETIKFSVTLARQRVVEVADPYRVGAYNAIIPTTHGHGTNISCIFSNSLQSLCRVRRLDAPLRRRRHRTQAGTKRIKQHKRNNKIFSDTCASKGRRGRRPLQGRCVQCNHTDNARARHEHFLHFLKFSAVHCRVRRLDAPLPPSAAQNASSKQSELNSMNIANAHSVPNFGLQIAALLYL